jgi:class 3 adenylate cyclase
MTITYVGVLHPAVWGLLKRVSQILTRLASHLAPRRSYGEKKLMASQQVSILVTDIVGFSDLMATWPLDLVVGSLNGYFAGLSRCVYRYGGRVDKFVGDGMMAVFQSPDDAVAAARAIQCEVAHYNSLQTARSGCPFPTRIIVDTGLAVRTTLGLGCDQDKTVMGPVVNSASHLAKTLAPDKVFISHDTCCRLTDRGGLWLTVAQATDRDGGRMAIYEVPALDVPPSWKL